MTTEHSISIGDLEPVPHTPMAPKANLAEAHDLQVRVNNAERELSAGRNKLAREARKNRRLQQQINEYMEALARAVQDCSMMGHQLQLLSNSHLALSQEYQKAKLMVETLEAVIRMLHTSSPGRLGSTESKASEE